MNARNANLATASLVDHRSDGTGAGLGRRYQVDRGEHQRKRRRFGDYHEDQGRVRKDKKVSA
jgi:hypothetical protein